MSDAFETITAWNRATEEIKYEGLTRLGIKPMHLKVELVGKKFTDLPAVVQRDLINDQFNGVDDQ